MAFLCHMSTDYYARLERERGPQPSEQMIASIAQGLHLSLDESDHLFRLAGHTPPPRGADSEHISPGLLRILDRLYDTPAEIVTELGETLRQTPPAVALTGDLTSSVARPAASATDGSPIPPRDGALRPRGPCVPHPHVRLGPARGGHAAGRWFPRGPRRRAAARSKRRVPMLCGSAAEVAASLGAVELAAPRARAGRGQQRGQGGGVGGAYEDAQAGQRADQADWAGVLPPAHARLCGQQVCGGYAGGGRGCW